MHSISSTWPELHGQFFQVFTRPVAEIVINLRTSWVLCTARRTVTGMLSFVDPTCKHAHDAYNRFFPDARWAVSQLMFSQRSAMVERLAYTRVVLWPSVSRKSIRDLSSREKDDFSSTTDIEMSAAEVLGCYCDRWAIEDTFKQTK